MIAAKALKYELFVVEAYKKDTYDVMAELKFHGALWSEPGKYAGVQQLETYAQQQAQDGAQAAQQGGLVTGKDRLEYAWSKLDDRWRQAYIPALRKASKVYIDHAAIKGVPEGKVIDPKRILPSRMVLTNKGKPQLEAAELKARWVFGGHRDPDAGAYPTASPTVSLVGHNLLNFLAVQFRWEIFYEDVSAAFLQGKELPPQREIYVKIPYGYPAEAVKILQESFGMGFRDDLAQLTKGGFGLPESPRLWYLEYRNTLIDIGGRELKLIPGFFCFYHPDGRLRAMACIHVDDTRYAGDVTAHEIWTELHDRLDFGKKRSGLDAWQKFCGRFERQDPNTFEVYYTMDEYCADIKKVISSAIGQVNWAARQCRFDLSYGASYVQQLASTNDPLALQFLNKVIRRAHQDFVMKVPCIGCPLEEMIVLSNALHQWCRLWCSAWRRKSGWSDCRHRPSRHSEGWSNVGGHWGPECQAATSGEVQYGGGIDNFRHGIRARRLHASCAGRNGTGEVLPASLEGSCKHVETHLGFGRQGCLRRHRLQDGADRSQVDCGHRSLAWNVGGPSGEQLPEVGSG